MISTILVAVIVGAIIGALARLVLPGKQSISTLVTVILGILGSLIGSWLVAQFGYSNASGGIAWVAVLAGVVVAALLIVGYGMATGRKQV